MRYLVLFMLLAGFFIFGKKACDNGNWSFGFGISGEGPVKTETRTVRDFHAISAQIPGTIEVRISEDYAVEVHAQENLLPLLKTVVKNGKLRIYFDENVSNAKGLKVLVSAPSFDAFELAGSGHLEAFDPIQGDKLELSIAGSGEIVLPEATVNKLNCDIAGAGDIQLGGRTTDMEFDIAGSGDIDAQKMVAEHGEINIAGSGTVNCSVNQTLKADISGSGDVYYSGTPTVDSDISGSGSVKRKN
jgi:hypothetical protein